MNNKKLIIWDWNGTLLNDVKECVDAMNVMLAKRGMKLLDREHYKGIFTFPVQDYYKLVGFDFAKESFEDLSKEYIDLYKEFSKQSELHIGTQEILKYFNDIGIRQIILSASEQNALQEQVKEREIESYFQDLIGLDNIYAKSKLQNAKQYIADSNYLKKNIRLIGDTYHDFEVAEAIGCNCVLIQNGHQVLNNESVNTKILNSLLDLQTYYSKQFFIEQN